MPRTLEKNGITPQVPNVPLRTDQRHSSVSLLITWQQRGSGSPAMLLLSLPVQHVAVRSSIIAQISSRRADSGPERVDYIIPVYIMRCHLICYHLTYVISSAYLIPEAELEQAVYMIDYARDILPPVRSIYTTLYTST